MRRTNASTFLDCARVRLDKIDDFVYDALEILRLKSEKFEVELSVIIDFK